MYWGGGRGGSNTLIAGVGKTGAGNVLGGPCLRSSGIVSNIERAVVYELQYPIF